MNDYIVPLCYLAAGGLFIVGLKGITQPKTARRGLQAAELGMLFAIIGTLVNKEIVDFRWIILAFVVGSAIGALMAVFVPMTAMPQRIALSHAFGALAAGLVGTAEYYNHQPEIGAFTMAAITLEVLLGFLTFTGSLMAFGKLHEILPGRPQVYRGQNVVNLLTLVVAVAAGVWLVADPSKTFLFPVVAVLAAAFGVMLIIPIGGADMPTVISLLNSYAGLSSVAMGFALDNKALIIAGALDGSAGFLLSVIMCRAMNRSFSNVLFGAFGAADTSAAAAGVVEERPVRIATTEEAAMLLETARSVIIVPGYGLAVAQAQHRIRELADALTRNGAQVRFAIHPVAGRMPGHMNVLLAEADVPYDQILDMDEINADFAQTDVALVVGANDVTNPAAKTNKDSPIYGMPILDVESARTVMVVKRGMKAGFAGVENELYYQDKTLMIFGDAKKVAEGLVRDLEASVHA
ncbi:MULTISPECIES: NAD(P)(+) transhydrogenase (Re/Si-specific) subunit beta [Pseudofrankia]|uniref:NAD(P)(+) transhydrogenase (Re/Si-specific) subunit beta n=1 Tax=Pseudofrankia TaxID=2994363 RepID=UPI000234C21F|nr:MULTISPECIES: NAD(P)(+) transhydrogenase (Re/Si-specific) subunit beta [Pseudofrankia]OHV30332.1 NAD synthetase [Pseudofrankia sp. EUN1h]